MRRMLACLLVPVALFAACSANNKVGSDKILDFKEKKSGLTPTPGPTKAAPAKTTAPKPAATTHQRPAAATPAPAARFAIAIHGAEASSAFDPPDAPVKLGTIVTWTNHDTQARSVVADGGAFKSRSIPAGKSWSYTATTAGTFTYHDGTRNYAVARLVVS